MESNETKTDLAMAGPAEIKAQPANPLMSIIQAASTNGEVDADKMLKLIEAAERVDANIAKKEFVKALAQFQADAPKLGKDAQGHTSRYTKLPTVIALIAPKETECGLSHSWTIKQDDAGIAVTCKITHIAGHCEETTLSADKDKSGNKSDIHALGSTVTYLKRYTLEAALGLAEEDDDGAGADKGKKGPPEPTPGEQKVLDAMCDGMLDSVPPGMILDRERVKIRVYAQAGHYPPEDKNPATCAAYLIGILNNDNSWASVCLKP